MSFTWGDYRAQRYEIQDFIRSSAANISQYGDNHDVGTTEEDLWRSGGDYNWIPAATQLKIASSSAQDAAAGTGIQQILIEGLDDTWTPISETITLTGQTPVTTTSSSWYRINAVTAVGTVGSGGSNAGDVYVYTGAEVAGVPSDLTKVYGKIEVGLGAALQAMYSTSILHEEAISAIQIAAAKGNDATISVYYRIDNGPWVSLRHYELYRANLLDKNGAAIPLEDKTDIRVSATAAAGTVSVGATVFLHRRLKP